MPWRPATEVGAPASGIELPEANVLTPQDEHLLPGT